MIDLLASPLVLVVCAAACFLWDRSEIALGFIYSGITYSVLARHFEFVPVLHLSIVGALIIGAETFRRAVERGGRIRLDPSALATAGFALGLTFGFLRDVPSADDLRGFQLFLLNAVLPLMYFTAVPQSRDRMRRFLLAYGAFSITGALLVQFVYVGGVAGRYAWDLRMSIELARGDVVQNIVLARTIGHGLIFALACAFFFFDRKSSRLIFGGIGLLLVQLLVVVNQRAPLYAIPFVLLLWFAWKWDADARARSNVSTRAVAVLVMLAVVFVAQDAMTSYFIRFQEGMDSGGRLAIYLAAFEGFLEHPLFGAGFGNAARAARSSSAHNWLLQIAVEGGVFALGLALAVLAVMARRIVTLARRPGSAEVRKLGLLAASLFVYDFLQAQVSGDLVSNSAVWLHIGVLNALYFSRFAPAAFVAAPNTGVELHLGNDADRVPVA